MRCILTAAFFIFGLCAATVGHADRLVASAQELLSQLGYQVGPADGIAGKNTIAAISQFYASRNQRFDGTIDARELVDLQNALNSKTTKPQGPKVDLICSVSSRYHVDASGANPADVPKGARFSVNDVVSDPQTKTIYEDEVSLVLEMKRLPNWKTPILYSRTIMIDKSKRRFQATTSFAEYQFSFRDMKPYTEIEMGPCKRQISFQSGQTGGSSFTFSIQSK
jgi:lysozyme family protein